ncbi:MAG: Mur ligase domain-containing protein, partial [Flavobacteriales bacterium]|nr:Mur ligase domain-containing protein [Flavobacteriales bacterium]
MKPLTTYQNFYFVGIGGIGMSALARYFNASGNTVLGYDKMLTKLTKALVEEGIDIQFEDIINDKIKNLTPENTLV